jgi:hypothetical protein
MTLCVCLFVDDTFWIAIAVKFIELSEHFEQVVEHSDNVRDS